VRQVHHAERDDYYQVHHAEGDGYYGAIDPKAPPCAFGWADARA
jgi:hypothetical protein